MLAVLQRVLDASVEVDQERIASIPHGWLVLLGIGQEDETLDIQKLINKIIKLRAFCDQQGKMNLDITQAKGQILVVSQFTLLGDLTKGNRPSFTQAAPPTLAQNLYDTFIDCLKKTGIPTAHGRFGAHMKVQFCNDGPVTFILNSKEI